MARQVLENGVVLPAEYSDDWYDDMTSNLTKLDDVIGSDSEKLSSADVGAAALSNNYNDLDNLPTIPTVNDATLTIQKNGVDVQTFTANASSNVTANITVPTKTSDLTNDSNFVVSSNLATVATSGDYDDLSNKPSIPTNTSDLINDSNFVDTSNSAVASGITSAKVTSYDSHVADTDIHVTTADKTKWNNGVTQSYVFRYSSTALVASSTNSNTLLDNTDNLKVGDKVIDSDGVLFSITAIDTANSTFTIGTALIDLALDANVMHLSGNEDVNGTKTFKDMIPIDGDYLGNEASTNQRTNICLRSNRDTAGKSCAYITRFRQNRAQGALQTGDLQMIGFDVLENEVRTNNVLSIQCTDWLNDVPQRINIICGAQSYSFGNSARKALFNDLNPGALSLPDLSNGIDISSYITIGNTDNNYTPPANGWIWIRLIGNGAAITQGDFGINANYVTENLTQEKWVETNLFVTKNVQATIRCRSITGIVSAKFYPCQGNV